MTYSVNDLEALDTGALVQLLDQAVEILMARLAHSTAELAKLDMVSTDEAARIVGVTPQSLRRGCRDRTIAHARTGSGSYLIPRAVALALKQERLAKIYPARPLSQVVA